MEEFEDIMKLKDKAYRESELYEYYNRLKGTLNRINSALDDVVCEAEIELKTPIFEGYAIFANKKIRTLSNGKRCYSQDNIFIWEDSWKCGSCTK